ncbi:hypothetical protein J4233_03010 [Candidatus Pacearchaeota archaeon]|nr:hypothetical protein [Candidatus Pacearchaeota archaeon]
MSKRNLLVFIASVFALAFAMGSVSAFGNIETVEVNGVVVVDHGQQVGSVDLANFVGDRVPVLVVFKSANGTGVLAEDVRIKAWISGEAENVVTSERFDVLPGKTYTRIVYLDIPSDLRNVLDESRKLELLVESKADGIADSETIDFTVQRASYVLEILSVDMQPEVNVGDSLVVDVVLKNRGRQFADDAFLTISIPELGLEERTYFGDLSPIDQSDPEKDDAVERRTYIKVPANAKPGLYDVTVEAFNADTYDKVDRRVLVVGGAVENTQVVAAGTSKSFNVGETESYKLTIVNRGTVVRVFELQVDSPTNLNVEISDPLVVVPAGTSRTVEFLVDSNTRDEYTFSVDVFSDGGALVDSETFSANIVEGNGSGGAGIQANTTVLLTVILAIIFVVLLVVLIVLLTRKPETKEEFGESYY